MEKDYETPKEFFASLTWKDVLGQFLLAMQAIEAYCKAHPGKASMSIEAAGCLGGMVAVYVGMRRIINDGSRYQELASPEMAETVLALCARVQRDLPEQPIAKGSV